MKLVVDIINFEHGRAYGYEEYLFNLLHYFAAHRSEIDAENVIVACQLEQLDYLKSSFADKFHYFALEGSSYMKRFYNSARLPYLLHLSEKDVILYTINYMPLLNSKCRKILVIHDLLFRHPEFCSRSLSFLFFRFQRYVYVPASLRKADKVIAISEFTKKEIMHYYNTNPDKIETIYNFFNFGKYNSDDVCEINEIKKPFFLSICSGVRHKNHEVMLRAFNKYCEKNSTDLFVLVGSLYPSAMHYLKSLSIEVQQRVVLLSHISNADINYLYKNAKGYISASLFEGLGMPVVEALHFNLPTFLSDTEIHREVSFNKAHYFEPSDWKSLASQMLNNTVSTDFTVEIEERYSEKNTSGRYVSVVNSLFFRGGGIQE